MPEEEMVRISKLKNIRLISQIVPIEDLGVQDEAFSQKDIIQKSISDYI